MHITHALLRWYDQSRRSLAFRGTRDPYRVWLSEIMLQQTRAQTVEGYYTRFLAQFPDVFALSRAQEQEVLKAWEGLGYYSRARNLHRAARMVVDAFGGQFPNTAEALRQLPGVGPYTAAAVASIAFDEPVPAIDGNLIRVLSRLYLVEEDVGIPSVKRHLYELGRALMPEPRAGDMNQALMDLGATICLPGTPDCAACPLTPYCMAYQDGEPERLPILPRKKPPREVPVAVVLLRYGDRVFVTRRTQALLKGLYVFYLLEGEEEAGVRRHLAAHGVQVQSLAEIGQARHIFTHRVWHMRIYRCDVRTDAMPGDGLWVTRQEMDALPFPTAMKAAKALAENCLELKNA